MKTSNNQVAKSLVDDEYIKRDIEQFKKDREQFWEEGWYSAADEVDILEDPDAYFELMKEEKAMVEREIMRQNSMSNEADRWASLEKYITGIHQAVQQFRCQVDQQREQEQKSGGEGQDKRENEPD